MAVTAKFKVSRLTPYGVHEIVDGRVDAECKMAEVEFTPDYAEGKNKDWTEATPSGVIRLTITNPAALSAFKLNEAYTVTFDKE